MQVEYITLGGNTTMQDTAGITPQTIERLADFRIKEGGKVLPLPSTALTVRLTVVEGGALFNIEKKGQIGFCYVCCFDESASSTMYQQVEALYEASLFKEALPDGPRQPIFSEWLYAIMVNPMALEPSEISMCGDAAFCIYYALFCAQKLN